MICINCEEIFSNEKRALIDNAVRFICPKCLSKQIYPLSAWINYKKEFDSVTVHVAGLCSITEQSK
jgi:hypothetical protein